MSAAKFDPTMLVVLLAAGAAVYVFTRKKTAKAAVPANYTRTASGGNPQNAPTTPNWSAGIVQGISAYLNGPQATPTPQLPVNADAIPVNPSTSYLTGQSTDYTDVNGFV